MEAARELPAAAGDAPLEATSVAAAFAAIRALEDERLVIQEVLAFLAKQLEDLPDEPRPPRAHGPRTKLPPDAVVRVRAMLAMARLQLDHRLTALQAQSVTAPSVVDASAVGTELDAAQQQGKQ